MRWLIWNAAIRGQARPGCRPRAGRRYRTDMMLLSQEIEKLMLYAARKTHHSRRRGNDGVAAKQRSPYERTGAISAKINRSRLRCCRGCQCFRQGRGVGHRAPDMLARTFRQMLVILEKNVATRAPSGKRFGRASAFPLLPRRSLIRQARRYKSTRDLRRALRLIARADLELRSSPPDKRLVLERLVLELASDPPLPASAYAGQQYAMQME